MISLEFIGHLDRKCLRGLGQYTEMSYTWSNFHGPCKGCRVLHWKLGFLLRHTLCLKYQ